MALNLDLSGSDAKIARAFEHFKALKLESEEVSFERRPLHDSELTITRTAVLTSIILCSTDFLEPRFGVILGDLVHNLRSALDYIISALAIASEIEVDRNHQFPIPRLTQGDYPGNAQRALDGIVHGRAEVERFQPFHRIPAHHDPLFVINYFSNSDKHRIISEYFPVLGSVDGGIRPDKGIISKEAFAPPQQWRANRKFEIARVTYEQPWPDPRKVAFKGTVSLAIFFGAPKFGKHTTGFGVPLDFFKPACEHVAMIVDTFKAL